MSAFPWLKLLGPPYKTPPPRRRRTPAEREAAILAAVRRGLGRTKTGLAEAAGGGGPQALRAIEDLEAQGVLRRGPAGYEIVT